MDTQTLFALLNKWNSKHYKRLGVGFTTGKGVLVKGTDGKVRIDAASGFGCVGLGHNHPRILGLLRDMNTPDQDGWALANVVPNAFATPQLAKFLERICSLLGYDRGCMTNSGAEAVESAIKLMRKWAYTEKGVPKNRARIIVCEGSFHGRTTTLTGTASDVGYRELFGPYAEKGFVRIPYNNVAALRKVLEADVKDGHPTIAGFLVEPIQGERGIVIPGKEYLRECYALCKEYRVVFCADEIQTGLGRTGKLLACRHDHVEPDLVILGKILGAGDRAIACVLGKEEFMVFAPGDHGSTYGGNAKSMALAHEVLNIIEEESLCNRSADLGADLENQIAILLDFRSTHKLVKEVRGRGLMIGIELAPGISSAEIIAAMLDHGVMTVDAHEVIRITPPLIITREECNELAKRIQSAFHAVAKKMS